MPRSATDATRFTSTTPHASTKPPAAGKIPSPNASRSGKLGSTGETPQQKVARLRAAAAKARDAKFTTFDKVLVHGRVWADRVHRFTTLSLIGITFICGGVTVYALGDMMIYNRKKRAEYYTQEKAIHQAAISRAKLALSEGVASEEQIAFLNREEEHDRQIAERKNKPGVWKRSKDWLFSDLKKDADIENAESSEKSWGADGTDKENAWTGIRESNILKAVDEKKEAAQSKVQGAMETERERQRNGGPLDRIGTSGDEEQPKSSGWTSFMNIKR